MDLVPYKHYEVGRRLYELHLRCRQHIEMLNPELVAIEHVRVRNGGKSIDSTMIAVRAQQVVDLTARQMGVPTVSAMAVQTRAHLKIKSRKTDPAKREMRLLINRLFQADLQRLGLSGAFGGGLPKSWEDATDAAGAALAAPKFYLPTSG